MFQPGAVRFLVFSIFFACRFCSRAKVLTKYVPLQVQSRVYSSEILVPTVGSYEVATPEDLLGQVQNVWDAVVEENQAGLVDPKHATAVNSAKTQPPLSKEEAWHHYKAGRDGIIDSARFLITFNLIPSIQHGGERIHIAATHNLYAEVDQLVDQHGVDVDAGKAGDGLTALIIACTLGHTELIDVLLKHGADVDLMSNNGITPLMAAASFGHANVVGKLLLSGALAKAAHPFAKTTALHFASEMGNVDVIKTLCRHQPKLGDVRNKIGGTPLHTAADTNQSASVSALLNYCKSNVEILMNGDTTPLYLASQRGFSEVIKTLVVDGGANIDFIMPTGKFKGELQAHGTHRAKYMYQQKNTEIGNGATALHAAVENGHLLATRTLLRLGAKQLPSMRGASPLLIALQYKHPRIAMALLSRNREAQVNVATKHDGMFPLFVASRYGYHKVVQRLLERGANVTQALNGQPFAAMLAATTARVKKIFEEHVKNAKAHDHERRALKKDEM